MINMISKRIIIIAPQKSQRKHSVIANSAYVEVEVSHLEASLVHTDWRAAQGVQTLQWQVADLAASQHSSLFGCMQLKECPFRAHLTGGIRSHLSGRYCLVLYSFKFLFSIVVANTKKLFLSICTAM